MKRDTSRYTVDGIRWPSVTEVLSLTGWSRFDRVPSDVLAQAADRGRWVHAATELIDQDDFDWGQIPIDRDGREQQKWLGYARAYRSFREARRIEITHREHFTRDDTHRFVGTLDIAGYLDGVPVVIDIKTSMSIAPSFALQTAAYQLALGGEARRRYALQLRADGTYRLHEFADPADRGLFLAAVSTVWAQVARGLIQLGGDDDDDV